MGSHVNVLHVGAGYRQMFFLSTTGAGSRVIIAFVLAVLIKECASSVMYRDAITNSQTWSGRRPHGRQVDKADVKIACVNLRSIRGIAQAVIKLSSHQNNLANG